MRKLGIAENIVFRTEDILKSVPQIQEDFENPAVALEKKHHVIDMVFPSEIRDFLKLLCDNGDMQYWGNLKRTPKHCHGEKDGFSVKLRYVTAPDAAQLKGIQAFVQKQYKDSGEISFEMERTLRSGAALSSRRETRSMTGVPKDVYSSFRNASLMQASRRRQAPRTLFRFCAPRSRILSWKHRIRKLAP